MLEGLELKLGRLASSRPWEGALEALGSRIDALEKGLAERPETESPRPPGDLALYFQARLELLEQRLLLSQQEAARANTSLKEREEAQQKARLEVERFFESMSAREKAGNEELRARLAMAEIRLLPADEVLACLRREGVSEALLERLRSNFPALRGEASPAPRPPAFEERGPRRLVEASLAAITEGLGKRDALVREMKACREALGVEPPGSDEELRLRERMHDLERDVNIIQAGLDKDMALVAAWVEREKQ
jgi:hypothetical protein